MKKNLLLKTFTILFVAFNLFAQKASASLSASVTTLTNDWCTSATGSLEAFAYGGTPPYTYSWDLGITTSIVTGLYSGSYNVTVTDNLGATATSAGIVGSTSAPQFYEISIVLANQGKSNGSVVVAIYPDAGGTGFPDGTYYYDLLNSSNVLIKSYSYTVPNATSPYYVFDSLPAGHYYINCSTSFNLGGCMTATSFDIKEIPNINPSFTALPACSGSPTGKIIVNTHPTPSIDANTFVSNVTSGLPFVSEVVSSKYKAIVYDSGNIIQMYKRTEDSAISISGLLPGNYSLKIYTGDTIDAFYPGNHDSVLVYSTHFTIANDTLCSLVKGKLFADYNNNCVYNGGDINLNGALIELNPGAYSAITNSNGEFYIPVPVGVYSLKQYAPYYYKQVCPNTNTFSINITSVGQIIDVQIADSVNTNPDASIGINASQPRPGFNTSYTIYYKNLTPNIISAQTVTLNYNAALTYVNSSPTASTSTPGLLTWNAGALGPFGQRIYYVNLNVPANTSIGTILNSDAFVTTAVNEINTANNIDAISQTVSGSFDPNEKEVSPKGFGSEGYITNSELLKYTIHFQNTGNDTAFNVTVADTLPSSLNKYSLQVLDASHPYSYEFKNSNVVLFHFNNILLPDSNTNEEESHGFIKFSIAQKPGNATNTIIKNNAAIVFDFNTPVITNSVKNTIYNCNQMATAIVNNQTICAGDSTSASSNLLFAMDRKWYVDSVLYSNNSSIALSGLSIGSHQLKFVASNTNCSQEIISNITVNPIPTKPIVTTNFTTLTSSAPSGNQWLYAGTVIAGANGTSHIAIADGWYSLLVSDGNGCSALSDSVYVLISGVKKINNDLAFTLLPNPANDKVQLVFEKGTQVSLITITDILGNEIIKQQPELPVKSITLSLSNLQAGIYFVNVKTVEGIVTKKLLRQ